MPALASRCPRPGSGPLQVLWDCSPGGRCGPGTGRPHAGGALRAVPRIRRGAACTLQIPLVRRHAGRTREQTLPKTDPLDHEFLSPDAFPDASGSARSEGAHARGTGARK